MSPLTEEASCNVDVSGDDNTYIILGGKNGNGDNINDLTYLILEALSEMNGAERP